MRASEHVAFANDAGGDGGGVDARVEFGVGGGLEHFFEAAAGFGEDALCGRQGLVGREKGGRGRACGGDGMEGSGGWVGFRWDVDHERKLVHELVFSSMATRVEAAEAVDHSACDSMADPDVAVDNPYYIPFGFSVPSAHVPDLRIRPQVVFSAISPCEIGVLLFDQYLGIVVGEVCEQLLEDWESWIIA